MTLPQNILAIDYGKIQSNKYVNIYMYFVFIVYPVIFVFFFAIFANSLLHLKIFNMQKLYPVLIAIRNFLNRKNEDTKKKSYTFSPIFANFVTHKYNQIFGILLF